MATRPTVAAQTPPSNPTTASSVIATDPHSVEREVRNCLEALPGLRVGSLVVHRTPQGVCLEGRVELLDESLDLSAALRGLSAMGPITNRLIVCPVGSTSITCDDCE